MTLGLRIHIFSLPSLSASITALILSLGYDNRMWAYAYAIYAYAPNKCPTLFLYVQLGTGHARLGPLKLAPKNVIWVGFLLSFGVIHLARGPLLFFRFFTRVRSNSFVGITP